MFKCRACQAKDDEIQRLVAELERVHAHLGKAQARLGEVALPGLEARLSPRPPQPISPVKLGERLPTFPGYPPERKRHQYVPDGEES